MFLFLFWQLRIIGYGKVFYTPRVLLYLGGLLILFELFFQGFLGRKIRVLLYFI
jgi:hypothetical protein